MKIYAFLLNSWVKTQSTQILFLLFISFTVNEEHVERKKCLWQLKKCLTSVICCWSMRSSPLTASWRGHGDCEGCEFGVLRGEILGSIALLLASSCSPFLMINIFYVYRWAEIDAGALWRVGQSGLAQIYYRVRDAERQLALRWVMWSNAKVASGPKQKQDRRRIKQELRWVNARRPIWELGRVQGCPES